MEGRRLPTTEDVVKKIKDDGDFDTLRLKIIRVVKENEELRKNIIEQVKQSDVLNQEGSEDMKPRQLSDAIYEELGRKITGQISDEIWKTIRLNESIKDVIKATVERVFNKMASAEAQTNGASSIPSLPHQNQIVGREANAITETSAEANILNSNETKLNPKSKNSDLQEDEEEGPGLIQNPHKLLNQNKAKDLLHPAGLELGHGGDDREVDDDSDLPPGFC